MWANHDQVKVFVRSKARCHCDSMLSRWPIKLPGCPRSEGKSAPNDSLSSGRICLRTQVLCQSFMMFHFVPSLEVFKFIMPYTFQFNSQVGQKNQQKWAKWHCFLKPNSSCWPRWRSLVGKGGRGGKCREQCLTIVGGFKVGANIVGPTWYGWVTEVRHAKNGEASKILRSF